MQATHLERLESVASLGESYVDAASLRALLEPARRAMPARVLAPYEERLEAWTQIEGERRVRRETLEAERVEEEKRERAERQARLETALAKLAAASAPLVAAVGGLRKPRNDEGAAIAFGTGHDGVLAFYCGRPLRSAVVPAASAAEAADTADAAEGTCGLSGSAACASCRRFLASLVNDQGAKVAVGGGGDEGSAPQNELQRAWAAKGKESFYCGQSKPELDVANDDGDADGLCGPNGGTACASCTKLLGGLRRGEMPAGCLVAVREAPSLQAECEACRDALDGAEALGASDEALREHVEALSEARRWEDARRARLALLEAERRVLQERERRTRKAAEEAKAAEETKAKEEATAKEEAKAADAVRLRRRVRALFDSMDTDGSGTISRKELAAKLRADGELEALLGIADATSSPQVMRVMRMLDQTKELDADGDQYVTYDEFERAALADREAAAKAAAEKAAAAATAARAAAV